MCLALLLAGTATPARAVTGTPPDSLKPGPAAALGDSLGAPADTAGAATGTAADTLRAAADTTITAVGAAPDTTRAPADTTGAAGGAADTTLAPADTTGAAGGNRFSPSDSTKVARPTVGHTRPGPPAPPPEIGRRSIPPSEMPPAPAKRERGGLFGLTAPVIILGLVAIHILVIRLITK